MHVQISKQRKSEKLLIVSSPQHSGSQKETTSLCAAPPPPPPSPLMADSCKHLLKTDQFVMYELKRCTKSLVSSNCRFLKIHTIVCGKSHLMVEFLINLWWDKIAKAENLQPITYMSFENIAFITTLWAYCVNTFCLT